jgi:hypothetical protein
MDAKQNLEKIIHHSMQMPLCKKGMSSKHSRSSSGNLKNP